jgi:uncharacterized protein involved in exopolysaccharide biosynthesis
VPAATGGAVARHPYGPYPSYQPGPPEAEKDGFIDLFEYWRIFVKRRWMIAATAATFLAFGTVYTLL